MRRTEAGARGIFGIVDTVFFFFRKHLCGSAGAHTTGHYNNTLLHCRFRGRYRHPAARSRRRVNSNIGPRILNGALRRTFMHTHTCVHVLCAYMCVIKMLSTIRHDNIRRRF